MVTEQAQAEAIQRTAIAPVELGRRSSRIPGGYLRYEACLFSRNRCLSIGYPHHQVPQPGIYDGYAPYGSKPVTISLTDLDRRLFRS